MGGGYNTTNSASGEGYNTTNSASGGGVQQSTLSFYHNWEFRSDSDPEGELMSHCLLCITQGMYILYSPLGGGGGELGAEPVIRSLQFLNHHHHRAKIF